MQGNEPKCYMLTSLEADTIGFCNVFLSLRQGEEVYVQIIGRSNNGHVGSLNMFSGHLINIDI